MKRKIFKRSSSVDENERRVEERHCPACGKMRNSREMHHAVWYKGNPISNTGVMLCDSCVENPKDIDLEKMVQYLRSVRWSEQDLVLVRKEMLSFIDGDMSHLNN
ncbi:MAG: hypothetical protein WCI93_01940 [bacterium]